MARMGFLPSRDPDEPAAADGPDRKAVAVGCAAGLVALSFWLPVVALLWVYALRAVRGG